MREATGALSEEPRNTPLCARGTGIDGNRTIEYPRGL